MAFEMNKEVVKEVPKDVILDGVLVDVEKTTWANIIEPDKLHKFDNPGDEIIRVKYEYKFENDVLKGEQTFKYYEKPMCNSNLGLFLLKYDELKVGTKVKIDCSGEGFPSIKIR